MYCVWHMLQCSLLTLLQSTTAQHSSDMLWNVQLCSQLNNCYVDVAESKINTPVTSNKHKYTVGQKRNVFSQLITLRRLVAKKTCSMSKVSEFYPEINYKTFMSVSLNILMQIRQRIFKLNDMQVLKSLKLNIKILKQANTVLRF